MTMYLRQQDVVDQPRLATTPITVVGAGAVGSFVVLGLAKIGVQALTVFDHDRVALHNLSNQWYGVADVGKPKVEALSSLVAAMTGTRITTKYRAFEPAVSSAVTICCVDSMDTRMDIWRELSPRPELYVDTRMGAEVGKVFCVGPHGRWYEEELYPSSEAFRAPCTARATMYCASGLAAITCAQVVNYVSGRSVRPSTTIDFRNTILI